MVMSERTEQPEELSDAVSVLSTTLNMIVKDFDRMDAAEIRELAWVAKYEVDRLIQGIGPNGIVRRI